MGKRCRSATIDKNNMIHDRVSMPRVLKHILLFTLGISGLAYIYNGSKEVGFGLSFTILASGILSTLASYGLISFRFGTQSGISIGLNTY
jgi:hypothetical protein